MNQQSPQSAERLNALLRVELAAVFACQNARHLLDGRLGDQSERLLGLAAGHQRNVAALQSCIRALGAVPTAEAGTWGSFALLRDGLSVQQLLEAEQRGLAEYEAALPSLDGEVRELVEQELMPRQRRHVATLSRILSELSPT
jgi:hypothetical protein